MSPLIGIVVGVVVILIVLWIFVRSSPYKKIFSETHYLEFAQALQTSAQAAAARMGDPPADPSQEDPRFFITSAGLACAYSINEENDLFDHHFSISVVGRPTPHAVGGPYTVFVARLLGLAPERLQTGVSENRVHHTMAQLTTDEHQAFAQRDTAITQEAVVKLFAECQELGAKQQFESFQAAPPA